MRSRSDRRNPSAVLLLSFWIAVLPGREALAQTEGPRIVEATPAADVPEAGKAGPAKDPGPAGRRPAYVSQGFVSEGEPNDTAAAATPLGGPKAVGQGSIYPNADVDFWSFTASAGDRVYAAVMTSASANGSFDSVLDLIGTDGTTVVETDDNDGSFGNNSSSIAGTTVPSAGTYYLKVKQFSATGQLRPYRLYLQVRSGSPAAEIEPNDTTATAAPLGAGWVSGAIPTAADVDYFSISLNAGDTVFASLDADPERDTLTWNPRLGMGLFGSPTPSLILVVNDANATSPNSEAFFVTVKDAGTYYFYVDQSAGAAATATYGLSVSVFPNVTAPLTCTTYTSTDVPKALTDLGLTSSTITIPGNPRIADLKVALNLTHPLMADLDVHLRSPAGNDNGLFTDVGATATGGQAGMDLVLDDQAAIPVNSYTVVSGLVVQPELNYRLAWFGGEDAGGTWTLDLRDDATGNAGTLNSWSLTVCTLPPPPSCSLGFVPQTVLSTDFEASDAGFTHSGTADTWTRGLPTAAPITTCASGTNCWKTNLGGTYTVSSSQDLLSAPVNLAGLSGPIRLSWAQRYQMESASYDHAYAEIRQVGGATPTRLWEWMDATMTNAVGNPSTTIQESAGWGVVTADVSSYAGQNVELRFHLDADTSVQLGGLAIDDVAITACAPAPLDLGDLPDTYGTLLASNGARHSVAGGPVLGVTVDTEIDGQPNGSATGDDISGSDDEDGVVFPPTLTRGVSNDLTVTASGAGLKLSVWIDADASGSFGAGEQVVTDLSLAAGSNTVPVLIPITTPTGIPIAFRFRASTAGGLGPTGLAADGEVEDYFVSSVLPVELVGFTVE